VTGIAAHRTVNARWEGGLRSVVEAGKFQIVADEPHSVGGSDTGPQPTDLLLASIASCFVLAMAWAARKREVELPDLHVRVVGTYDGPKFSQIDIDVDSEAAPAVLDELLPLAERVCYVTNTLRDPPRLRVGHRRADHRTGRGAP
jgi:putative redox protein